MINSLTVINSLGEALVIDLKNPSTSGFFIRSINGLGPLKNTINISESLYGDGGYFNSARRNIRNILIDLGFYNDYSDSIELIRNKSYRFFQTKEEITFEIDTDSRTGVITGYVESNEPDIFSKDEGSQISVLCPEPFFYEKEMVETLYSGTSNNFQFPYENADLSTNLTEFGTIFINTQASVFYTGDVPTGIYMTISFFGTVTGLAIHNLTTGQDMLINSTVIAAITGGAIQSGDVIYISTVTGNKYIYLVRAGISYNILNALGTSTQWIIIKKGDNVITYTATTGLSNINMLINHSILYEGL